MKYSKEEIRKSMLLYAVTDRMWLKEGEKLTDVCRKCAGAWGNISADPGERPG